VDLGVSGRNYIIVGGTKGMGWATAEILAENGANLALISRDTSAERQWSGGGAGSGGAIGAERASTLAQRYGVRVLNLAADASRSGEVEQAVQRAIDELGPIRGLLTTPGSTHDRMLEANEVHDWRPSFADAKLGDVLDLTDDEWEVNFQRGLMTQVRSCRAILPHLLGQGGGNIVTVSAYSAKDPKDFLYAYSAFKASLINFTKNLCHTYAARGIRANCVCPGAINTWPIEYHQAAADKYGLPVETAMEHVMINEWKMPIDMRRVGRPDEVGDLMAFLLSERAAYINGGIYNIDGGSNFGA